MKIEGNTLFFTTTSDHFYRERRVVNSIAQTLGPEEGIALLNLVESTGMNINVHIKNSETGENFTRHLRSITADENHEFLVFTWDPNSGSDC